MKNITPERIDELWQQAFDNTEEGETVSHRFAALLFAEPAPVQPVKGCQHKRYSVDAREGTGTCHDCGAEGQMQFVVGDTSSVARVRQLECVIADLTAECKELRAAQPAPATEGREWSLLEATQESLREHMAEIKRLKAAHMQKREHITDGGQCWCNPDIDYIDPDTGAAVIVHKEPQ